jgi:hypothetical protein
MNSPIEVEAKVGRDSEVHTFRQRLVLNGIVRPGQRRRDKRNKLDRSFFF